MKNVNQLRRIRFWLALFTAGLILSGITAFPLQTELPWLVKLLHISAVEPLARSTHLLAWIERVDGSVESTGSSYPFLFYGTDWLAFAHLAIAVAFVGPWIDPVRNKWVITFGLIACAGVVPLALVAGHYRGIPLPWRMIDCSFGIVGAIPLAICRRAIRVLECAEPRASPIN